MSGYIIGRENQEIVVNIPNVEQLSTTSVIFAGGLSLSDLENEEVNDILELVEAYSPGGGGSGPTPPTPGPTTEPFYVPGWFEHQDGNWVLIKAGQTWEIRYSNNGGSTWTDVSYTAGDIDTWFNMDNEPFRMAKQVKRKVASATGDDKILAMNLDMPNYSHTFSNEGSSSKYVIFRDPAIVNVKIKIDYFGFYSRFNNTDYLFYGNSQMTTCEIEQYRPELSTITSMNQMFYNCNSLQLLDLSNLNTSNVTSTASMFYNCNSLQLLDLSNLNTSNVTSMSSMFWGCYLLQSIKGLEIFNTSNVTGMRDMFNGCCSLQSLDLNNWNVSNVTDMYGMFNTCCSLQSFDLNNWNVSNVATIDRMFEGCFSLQSLDLSNWDLSNIASNSYMFQNCRSLQSLDLSNWDLSNATNTYGMFNSCYAIQDIKIKTKPKTTTLPFFSQNSVLSNDSLKWMADNFIDISGDDTYTDTTISGFSNVMKSRYMWQYFYDTMTAKGYTIS